jgi:hypothetical protein
MQGQSGNPSSGSGTVTSVALAMPAMFSVSGSPVTASGTLTASLSNQSANAVFAGPSSGAAAAPSFRALVPADIPVIGSAQLAAANTRRVCNITVGSESGAALANADLGPQSRQCFIPAAATIVEITVAADAGTPSVLIARNHAGTQSNLTASALATAASGGVACANASGSGPGIDGATTCSAALTTTSLAAGDWLDLVSGTAGGTARRMSIAVTYTIN